MAGRGGEKQEREYMKMKEYLAEKAILTKAEGVGKQLENHYLLLQTSGEGKDQKRTFILTKGWFDSEGIEMVGKSTKLNEEWAVEIAQSILRLTGDTVD